MHRTFFYKYTQTYSHTTTETEFIWLNHSATVNFHENSMQFHTMTFITCTKSKNKHA